MAIDFAMQPVKSSTIAAIGYHAPSRTLEVQFKNGSRYQYQNVMVPDYEGLIHADSIGSWFSQKIKALPDTFPCTKVEPAQSTAAPRPSAAVLTADLAAALDKLDEAVVLIGGMPANGDYPAGWVLDAARAVLEAYRIAKGLPA